MNKRLVPMYTRAHTLARHCYRASTHTKRNSRARLPYTVDYAHNEYPQVRTASSTVRRRGLASDHSNCSSNHHDARWLKTRYRYCPIGTPILVCHEGTDPKAHHSTTSLGIPYLAWPERLCIRWVLDNVTALVAWLCW